MARPPCFSRSLLVIRLSVAAAVIVLGWHALWTLRSWALRRAPTAVVAVELARDGRAVLVERGGRRCEGRVQADSYVGEQLTTLVVRLDGARVTRAIAILPDMLPAEDLRLAAAVAAAARRIGVESIRVGNARSAELRTGGR